MASATRRACLAGMAALASGGRAAAQAPGLALEDLLEIGDDDRGVTDALAGLLWRAASLAEIVAQAGLPAQDAAYAVGYAEGGPAGMDPNALPKFFFFNDRLAVALACDVVATYAGAYTGAVKGAEVAAAADREVASPLAVGFSTMVYRRLLMQTRARPDSAPFADYLGDPGAWGPKLVAAITDDAFFTSIGLLAATAPDKARRRLRLTRFKVQLLAPAAVAQVRTAWKAPALQGTVFPIAADEPWPENFYLRFRNGGPNPMKPLIDKATTVTRQDSFQQCRNPSMGSRGGRVCHDAVRDVAGEAVWHLLQNRASAYGWLGTPRYPDGYKA